MTDSLDKRTASDRENESYLADHFDKRGDGFKTINATSEDLREVFFHLRHEVYCEDHPEFNEVARVDAREMDEFDDHSDFVLLMYKPLAMLIGGTRIVMPQLDREDYGLPCLSFEESPFLKIKSLPFKMEKMAELSRVLIAKRRMNILEREENVNHATPFAHITRGAYKACLEKGLEGIVAVLSPVLIRRSQALGVSFMPIGDPVNYHGERQAAYILFDECREILMEREHKKKHAHFFFD